MAIQFPDNIKNDSPKVLDDAQGVWESGGWRPWNTVSEYTVAYPADQRAETQILFVRNTSDSTKADMYIVDRNKVPQLFSGGGGSSIEPWIDVISFTYNGSNNTQTLSFTPKNIKAPAFLNSVLLNPYSDFVFNTNTIVVDTDFLTLGIEYRLYVEYYK